MEPGISATTVESAAAVPSAVVKCLVWDLDETLWRGTLLENDDVHLDPPVLEVIRGLDARGILQSVASRNEHDLALAKLEELGVAQYFLAPRIGWGRKSTSVREIAAEFGFAESAIAFVDDNPAELAEVAYHLPAVRCYSADMAAGLLELPEFSPASVTVDASRRRELYQANINRERVRSAFAGTDDDFLRTLDLQLRITRATPGQLSRVAELTLRTSQMNATGVYFSEGQLLELLDDPRHEVLVATLSDRFGSHGAIAVVLLEKRTAVWHLKLVTTSCRVISCGVGTHLLNWVSGQAVRAGVHVIADFRRTDRNRIMEIAYRFAGFTEQDCACRACLPGAQSAQVQRLHLTPQRQHSDPGVVSVSSPELAAPSADPFRPQSQPESSPVECPGRKRETW
jgi:methoxymalonate biosynthesis protein